MKLLLCAAVSPHTVPIERLGRGRQWQAAAVAGRPQVEFLAGEVKTATRSGTSYFKNIRVGRDADASTSGACQRCPC